jgi:hypothetical protein
MQPAGFNPRLPSLVDSNQEIEQRAQKGQEDNEQYPEYLFISLKIASEGTDQCKEWNQEYKDNHQKGN